jgi:predicted amidophosphoribosyltransferase
MVVEVKSVLDDVKALQLGIVLGTVANRTKWAEDVDGVVPVPSHWLRRFSRKGLHVTGVIAEGFCLATGLRVFSALKCAQLTNKQSRLTTLQRIQNNRGNFVIRNPKLVAGKHLILLDDVMTTGSTVRECANALMAGGAQSIRVAVIARAANESL